MICDELDWGSSQINTTWLFITKWPIQRNLDLWWTWLRFITNHPVPQAQVWKESVKNWSKVLKTVWFCDEPQSSSSQTEVVPPILICDEQQLHSSEIQVHGHFRFLRSLAMGSTKSNHLWWVWCLKKFWIKGASGAFFLPALREDTSGRMIAIFHSDSNFLCWKAWTSCAEKHS